MQHAYCRGRLCGTAWLAQLQPGSHHMAQDAPTKSPTSPELSNPKPTTLVLSKSQAMVSWSPGRKVASGSTG